jgi:hypothetical protein
MVYINRNDPEQNGMNEYERETVEWNQSEQVQEMRGHRAAMINNTHGYRTGNRIHHLRSIQMYSYALWNEIFGREILDPVLRNYAQGSLDWTNDETNTRLFAGQMDVSLLMQENYRPGVHVAIFFIHLSPHRQFRDGHMIQMEFGNGSYTHQTINRMFDLGDRAIVLQATEYQMLEYLADDDEAMDLLHSCFIQPDFEPMRFTYVEPEDDEDDNGIYVFDRNAPNNHRWHMFAVPNIENIPEDHVVEIAPAIPPPPPVNNFSEIYQEYLRQYDIEYRYHQYNDIYYNDINQIDIDNRDNDEFQSQARG